MPYTVRHHFRLDDATENALEEICRHTLSAKSTLMRRYVQEGVARDALRCAQGIESVKKATQALSKT